MENNMKEKIPTAELGDQDTARHDNNKNSNDTQEKNVELNQELSLYYYDSKNRLMKLDGDREKIVSEHYIKLKALVRNTEGEGWEDLLEFIDLDNNLKTISIPRSILIDKKEVTKRLADSRFPTLCPNDLMSYFQTETPKERLIRVTQNGWISNSLDYIGKSFQIVNSSVKYIAPSTDQIASKGTLEEWKENICRYCENNHILTLALCVSMSGLLLKFQDFINSTMINLTGKSSIGKTTALQVASSIWGDSNFIRQWRTISNALESVAAEHNHGLLILDELGQVSAKDVSQIFYMLGNERGKQRMYSDTSLRKSKHWKLAILSSGEVGISDKIDETGTKVKAGQLVRCIDIEANIGDYGIYNTLHGFENGSVLSNFLKQNCEKYYGTSAEEFTKKLIQNQTYDTLKGSINEIMKEESNRIIEKFDLKDADGQVLRVVDIKFALYVTTGLYASKFGIFMHTENQIRDSIDFCFDRWLHDRGGNGAFEERDIIENVFTFLIKNEARFDSLRGIGTPPRDKLGYIEKQCGENATYYIIPKLFQREVCAGMNQKTVRNILQKSGIMETYEDGRAKYVDTKDGRQRLIIISFRKNSNPYNIIKDKVLHKTFFKNNQIRQT